MFTTWLVDMITDRGIGNGISMIIMAGIIARVPDGIRQAICWKNSGSSDLWQTDFIYCHLIISYLGDRCIRDLCSTS